MLGLQVVQMPYLFVYINKIKLMKEITYFIIGLFFNISAAQVGIGTTNPQQELHVAGNTSTIRIESLNTINEPVLNTGVKLAPTFVTPNGDITLDPSGYGTGTDPEPLNFLIDIPDFVPNGLYGDGTVVANDATTTTAVAQIASVPFNCPQSALFEARYVMTVDLSDQVLPAPAASTFNDVSARTIRCYFYVDLNSDGFGCYRVK